MSFSIVVYLYCNGQSKDCPYKQTEACFGDGQYTTIKEYKEDYKEAGWHFVGHKAYCPTCWKDKRKKAKNGN